MAKRKKKKVQTFLTAGQKKQLSGLLAIVRRFPRKKKPAIVSPIGGGGSSGSTCVSLANQIVAQTRKVNALAAAGIATTAQYNFFAEQQGLLQALLTNFAAQKCSQSLIVGKI